VSSIEQLEGAICQQMERWQVPGLAIGIYQEGRVETAAYGVANVETGCAVTPGTLFQIGSISKVFTATLVMSLVEEGTLDLDQPVIAYVPELPLTDEAARRTITLRHLLTHMAGFYGDRFDDHGDGDDALARAVAAFADLPQQTAPGELWTYCNAGFDLAGRAVERVLGVPFEQAMRERVFAPLGLERTTYFAKEAIRHAVAAGHVQDRSGVTQVADPWPIPRRSNPAGGISSTVEELLRFAACHLHDGEIEGRRILSPASARAMRTVQTAADYGRNWGLGWSLRQVAGTTVVEHNGATNGFMARLTLVPDRQFAIAVLTNGEYGSPAHGAIASVALDRLLGLRADPPARQELSTEQLARFAGRYSHGLADLTLTVEGNGYLVERVTRNPFSGEEREREPFRLAPIGETVFIAEGGDLEGAILEVFQKPDGAVRFIRFGGRLGYPA
jgi:CubicO group peptidase (beta-lactamase class C family)